MENGDVVRWRMGISGLTKVEGLDGKKECKRKKGRKEKRERKI